MRISLTAIYEPAENGWTQARIEELPAVITAGPTAEEARELLLDALREYFLSFVEERQASASLAHAKREPLEIIVGA